jgi:hypothetical protein
MTNYPTLKIKLTLFQKFQAYIQGALDRPDFKKEYLEITPTKIEKIKHNKKRLCVYFEEPHKKKFIAVPVEQVPNDLHLDEFSYKTYWSFTGFKSFFCFLGIYLLSLAIYFGLAVLVDSILPYFFSLRTCDLECIKTMSLTLTSEITWLAFLCFPISIKILNGLLEKRINQKMFYPKVHRSLGLFVFYYGIIIFYSTATHPPTREVLSYWNNNKLNKETISQLKLKYSSRKTAENKEN